MASEVYKGLFSIKETTQILFGPCKERGSDYVRTIRMVNDGAIESIADRDRKYVARSTLINLMGSEDELKKALQKLDNVVELYADN